MPSLLTQASQMMCPHGGTVTATPSSTKVSTKSGGTVVRGTDTFTIAGCPFTLPSATPHPCMSVQWQVTATKVKDGGDFALNEASVGLCLAADQAPQGTVVIASTQTDVAGI
jgi:hypothetical protein